jgi:two-component system sensor histidine kinase KdpD
MTRLEAGGIRMVKEPADLQDLIGTALKEVIERLEARPVSVDVPDSLPFVTLDYVLIVQVLVNLLDNAIKYSPPDSPIEIQARQASTWVEIQIADRGTGIPPEDLERVFDKFYRVHRPEGVSGTGLGLSICKGIVEAHGGTIQAENRPGGGTILRIRLPMN